MQLVPEDLHERTGHTGGFKGKGKYIVISIRNQSRPLNEEEIRIFEGSLGVTLPEEYRRFLLTNNGGRPTPDTIDIEGLRGGEADIKLFFKLTDASDLHDLRRKRSVYFEDLGDPTLLPIANDSFGYIYSLCIAGQNLGKIFYVDFIDGHVAVSTW